MTADNAELGWIQTFTGKQFYPLAPIESDIDIEDIAHALSMQCRFTGHCREFYSVAEHSVEVSKTVPREFALWGLLHDASEAYLTDLSKPLKMYSDLGARYVEIESRLQMAICKRFGLQLQEPEEVKVADRRMLMTEKKCLMGTSPARWDDNEKPYSFDVLMLQPWQAESYFLDRFEELTA